MDGILRGSQQPEIKDTAAIEADFQKASDMSGQVVLFPVRHHSPACSYHLTKVIEEYKPEAVLIEGPQNSNHLIEHMVSTDTRPPFCIYLSFDDKKGKIGEKDEKYRAFYPFLDYSPELVALRCGTAAGAVCRFIDMSYAEKLINTPKRGDDGDYLSDREFLQSSYYKAMTERLGCKSFNELWEMLFEIEGVHMDTQSFLRNMFFFCAYSRENTESEELSSQGDIIREYCMAENIRQAMQEYSRILVVTGGIHTIELVNLIYATAVPDFSMEKIKSADSPSYLMPYSFEESDFSSGYSSGMEFPFFYQRVWENIVKNRPRPYEESVLKFIINVAGIVRKKQALSISDEMQSYYMARGLCELRGKKECGVYEVIDAVKSSFVKGEINSYHQPALKTLLSLMTGMSMGTVSSKAGVPPIVLDFQDKCKKFKILTNTSMRKESKLDVYSNAQHREKSRFFHQMSFMETGFCKYLKGPDSNQSSGRILLRETWEYKFSPGVQVALISNSAYGGTTEQACYGLIVRALNSAHLNSNMLSELLLKANYMGIDGIYTSLYTRLRDIIGEDMDFVSVVKCFNNLLYVKNYREVTKDGGPMSGSLNVSIDTALKRALTLMYTVTAAKREDEDKICQCIKSMYTYFVDNPGTDTEDIFMQNVESFGGDVSLNGALSGICTGIQLKRDKITSEEAIGKFDTYIEGSAEAKKMSASFLKGFFMIAKDIVFVDDRLIESLDNILRDTSGDTFLDILPDLRLAFTYFLPFETDKIAKRVAALYDVSQTSIMYGKAVDQQEMEYAASIDAFCRKNMLKWNIE